MGYRPKNRPGQRPPGTPVEVLPEPPCVQVYDPADWLADDAPPEPADGFDVPAWEAWEQAHREAYRRYLEACQLWHDWQDRYGQQRTPVEADEPFDADDMLAFNRQRVTRSELVELQAAYRAEHSG
jgi:hypothetical protein